MPITPPHRGYQPYDGLITADDLPEGWYLPDRFPGERDDDASNEIDAILGYDDSLVTNEQRQSQAVSDENETVDGRWRYIEHTETHTRVMIRGMPAGQHWPMSSRYTFPSLVAFCPAS